MQRRISPFASQNPNLVNTAFIIGFFTILGAWAFELIGGYEPCRLCLTQRIPYYAGLPLIALLLVFWKSIAPPLRIAITILSSAIFIWSAYLGSVHAGIEWGLWPGPSSCTGDGGTVNFSDLNSLDDVRIIPCDQPRFRFLGISFAGYNALISALISLLLLRSAIGQYRSSER